MWMMEHSAAVVECLSKKSEEKLMKAREAIDYLKKLGSDEPVFILRAQDIIAPYCVEKWVDVYEGMGGAATKAAEARAVAEQMVKWTGTRKFPD